MQIIKLAPLTDRMELIDKVLPECNELISIFVKSVETARKNNEIEKRNKRQKKDKLE